MGRLGKPTSFEDYQRETIHELQARAEKAEAERDAANERASKAIDGYINAREECDAAKRSCATLMHEHGERQKERDAALEKQVAALREALEEFYAAYEDGTPCYEDPDDCAGFLGNAVDLHEEYIDRIEWLLNDTDAAATAEAYERRIKEPLEKRIAELEAQLDSTKYYLESAMRGRNIKAEECQQLRTMLDAAVESIADGVALQPPPPMNEQAIRREERLRTKVDVLSQVLAAAKADGLSITLIIDVERWLARVTEQLAALDAPASATVSTERQIQPAGEGEE